MTRLILEGILRNINPFLGRYTLFFLSYILDPSDPSIPVLFSLHPPSLSPSPHNTMSDSDKEEGEAYVGNEHCSTAGTRDRRFVDVNWIPLPKCRRGGSCQRGFGDCGLCSRCMCVCEFNGSRKEKWQRHSTTLSLTLSAGWDLRWGYPA